MTERRRAYNLPNIAPIGVTFVFGQNTGREPQKGVGETFGYPFGVTEIFVLSENFRQEGGSPIELGFSLMGSMPRHSRHK